MYLTEVRKGVLLERLSENLKTRVYLENQAAYYRIILKSILK
jgi:hypothetical protein